MNNERRKRIEAVVTQLSVIEQELINLANEEQAAFDAMPESLQDGERGQKMESAIDCLQEVESELSEAAERLTSEAAA